MQGHTYNKWIKWNLQNFEQQFKTRNYRGGCVNKEMIDMFKFADYITVIKKHEENPQEKSVKRKQHEN